MAKDKGKTTSHSPQSSVDAAKAARIAAEIAAGDYKSDPGKIAKALIDKKVVK